MSRLDSAIARLMAQRVCLGFAAAELLGRPGCVLELGLGNGRTYDHIRSLMPERRIYVFDLRIAAHEDTIPPKEFTYLGEMSESLPRAARDLGAAAVLVHADIGGGNQEQSNKNAALIGPLLPPLLLPGGLVAVDQELNCPELQPVKPPEEVPDRRYFKYRCI
jgi:hypothetical protein